MTISMIVAVAENGVIGRRGVLLPWRLRADLARFKQLTMDHPIIMGRKTYDTIGRPLPGRHNIIISRDAGYPAPGSSVVGSLPEALALAAQDKTDEVFVIGGGTIYKEALDQAQRLYLTLVHATPEGDVFFTYDPTQWQESEREDHQADEKNEHDYSFLTLTRRRDT